MPSSTSIFTPADNSLQERIIAYQRVVQAKKDIDSSLNTSNQQEWTDRLGSTEELSKAKEIIEKSLLEAVKSFKTEEISRAQQENLFSKDDAKDITILSRKAEMQNHSKSAQSSKSQSRKT